MNEDKKKAQEQRYKEAQDRVKASVVPISQAQLDRLVALIGTVESRAGDSRHIQRGAA